MISNRSSAQTLSIDSDTSIDRPLVATSTRRLVQVCMLIVTADELFKHVLININFFNLCNYREIFYNLFMQL